MIMAISAMQKDHEISESMWQEYRQKRQQDSPQAESVWLSELGRILEDSKRLTIICST